MITSRRLKLLSSRLFKSSLWLVALIVTILLGFFSGWKSFSPSTRTVETLAARPPAVTPLVPDRRSAPSVTATLTEARASIRFKGHRQLGEALAYAKIEALKPSQYSKAFAEAIAQPRTASGDRLIDFILDCWGRVDPQAAVTACAGAFHRDRERFLDRARMPPVNLARRDPKAALQAWRTHWQPLKKDHDDSAEYPLTYIFSN